METDDRDFEGELFLSTDGKNTVHIKASTPGGRKAALSWAKKVYDKLKEEYGTKQNLNAETYGPKNEAQKKSLGKCPKCGAPNAISLRGKIYCSNKCWLEENQDTF